MGAFSYPALSPYSYQELIPYDVTQTTVDQTQQAALRNVMREVYVLPRGLYLEKRVYSGQLCLDTVLLGLRTDLRSLVSGRGAMKSGLVVTREEWKFTPAFARRTFVMSETFCKQNLVNGCL